VKTLVLIALMTAACTTAPATDRTMQSSTSTSTFDWPVGEWTCSGHYHDVPPFAARTEDSSYVFSIVDGNLTASYRAVQNGQQPLPGSDEIWSPLGDGVGMTIQLAYTDGALTTTGSGVSQGPVDDVTRGLADFTGVTVDARGDVGVWRHDVTLTVVGGVSRLSMDSYLGNSFRQRLYLDSSCTLTSPE
jgi:hypothetical protein